MPAPQSIAHLFGPRADQSAGERHAALSRWRNRDSGHCAASGSGRDLGVQSGRSDRSTVRAHLFDRFYRRDASRSNSHDSHGLGLSIVKAVAEMHNVLFFSAARRDSIRLGFPWRKALRPSPRRSHAGPRACQRGVGGVLRSLSWFAGLALCLGVAWASLPSRQRIVDAERSQPGCE